MIAEKISLAQQIEEAEYGRRARKSMYDADVARGKMRESVRDHHVKRLDAIIDTLRWLRANEAVVRAAVSASKSGGQS